MKTSITAREQITGKVREHGKTWDLFEAWQNGVITLDQFESAVAQIREDCEQRFYYGPIEQNAMEAADEHAEYLGVG